MCRYLKFVCQTYSLSHNTFCSFTLKNIPFITKPTRPGWTLQNSKLGTWQRRRASLDAWPSCSLPTCGSLFPAPQGASSSHTKAVQLHGHALSTPASNSHPWLPLRCSSHPGGGWFALWMDKSKEVDSVGSGRSLKQLGRGILGPHLEEGHGIQMGECPQTSHLLGRSMAFLMKFSHLQTL